MGHRCTQAVIEATVFEFSSGSFATKLGARALSAIPPIATAARDAKTHHAAAAGPRPYFEAAPVQKLVNIAHFVEGRLCDMMAYHRTALGSFR